MRFGSTARVLAKRKLEYYRISKWKGLMGPMVAARKPGINVGIKLMHS